MLLNCTHFFLARAYMCPLSYPTYLFILNCGKGYLEKRRASFCNCHWYSHRNMQHVFLKVFYGTRFSLSGQHCMFKFSYGGNCSAFVVVAPAFLHLACLFASVSVTCKEGFWYVFRFSYFAYFYANNTFITSKFIVLYMSDVRFIIVSWLFNVCCRFEVKTAQKT
jgi:hypothetical protein